MNLYKFINKPTDKMARRLPLVFLFLITVLAYMPAIRHGGFVWDDGDNATDNSLLRSASGLRGIWTRIGPDSGGTIQYYPLTYSSFWAEYRLWGLWPNGYHPTNVILHALNAILVWLILLRLRVPGALLARLSTGNYHASGRTSGRLADHFRPGTHIGSYAFLQFET